MKKILVRMFLFTFILGGILLYRFESRNFVDFKVDNISISDADEGDFLNSPLRDKENPMDYFDVVFDIKAKNKSENLCVENIGPHIIVPSEYKEDLIEVGVTQVSDDYKIIFPKKEKSFPYKIFFKKNNYSKEEVLDLLKNSSLKINILSFKKGSLKYLTYGGSTEYIK